MVVYICLDCGRLFGEPKHYVETHGLDAPPYEEWEGCPSCGGSYAETCKCDGCSNWVYGQYMEIVPSGEIYCEECFRLRNIGD